MTNSRALSEVSARLAFAFDNAKRDDMTPQEQYDLYEYIAIQILDSEFDQYEEGALEAYLTELLESMRNVLL